MFMPTVLYFDVDHAELVVGHVPRFVHGEVRGDVAAGTLKLPLTGKKANVFARSV
jgi:hypothetical protein